MTHASRNNKVLPEILVYGDLERSFRQHEWMNLAKLEYAKIDVSAFDTHDGSGGLIMGDQTHFQELINQSDVIYFSNTDIIPANFPCRTDEVVAVIAEFKKGVNIVYSIY